MTAPLPPDPADVLTRLEELHKAATPGPWQADREAIYPSGATLANAETLTRADAAVIVAEHNAMPALLAAARGVLALAEELERDAKDQCGPLRDRLRDVATRLRSTLAAAVGETGGGR